MELVSVKDLIEAGAHFGHTTSRWNPKMKPYIFGKQNRIHIIDIRQTLKGLLTAYYYLKELAKKGELILFVGTKQQSRGVIQTEATRCGMPYVSERWLGGTLTNFNTIRLRLNKLLQMEKAETDGTLERYNKEELSTFRRELGKLRVNLGGIRNLDRLPAALVAVDYKESKIPLAEARRMKIKTVTLIDTDADPSNVSIPIPLNDDGMRVIQIVIAKLADGVLEGKSQITKIVTEKPAPAPRVSHPPAAGTKPRQFVRRDKPAPTKAGPGAVEAKDKKPIVHKKK